MWEWAHFRGRIRVFVKILLATEGSAIPSSQSRLARRQRNTRESFHPPREPARVGLQSNSRTQGLPHDLKCAGEF